MTNFPSFRKDVLPTFATILNLSQFFLFTLQFVFIYYPPLRWFLLAYYIWIHFIDNETPSRGTRWSLLSRKFPLWKYIVDYFPLQLIKSPQMELDPKRNYLFCVFPHGVMPYGAGLTFSTEALNVSEIFPHHKSYVCTLKPVLDIPICREVFMANGAVPASKKCLNYLLSRPGGGNLATLFVGGVQEAFYNEPGRYKLVLKNRKGFVRIALTNGSPLVPVLSFGEPDVLGHVIFSQDSLFCKIQLLLKKYSGLMYLIPIGRGFSFLKYNSLPLRKPITVVVGEPIDVPKIETPTQEQVDEFHGKFITKLTELFEGNKLQYVNDAENIHLEIL